MFWETNCIVTARVNQYKRQENDHYFLRDLHQRQHDLEGQTPRGAGEAGRGQVDEEVAQLRGEEVLDNIQLAREF